jgi:DNA-binding winged helix-turn-helix (wHTH) protein
MRRQLSFGPFTLDPDARQLVHSSDRRPVHRSRKAFELLTVLADARPRAISKQELRDRLWPSTFISEATIASVVAELRDALGERGREGRYIRTVHGFGYSFVATARESATRDVSRPRTWIVCDGQEQPLADGEHVIGRDPDVAISLRSPSVSRHHARIVIGADNATIEDLGSKNGTLVRGQPVTSAIPLADGDRIRVGGFELTFCILTVTGRRRHCVDAPDFRRQAWARTKSARHSAPARWARSTKHVTRG